MTLRTKKIVKVVYYTKTSGYRWYQHFIDTDQTEPCCDTMMIFIDMTDKKPQYHAIDLKDTNKKADIPNLIMFVDMYEGFPAIKFCPWCGEKIEFETGKTLLT